MFPWVDEGNEQVAADNAAAVAAERVRRAATSRTGGEGVATVLPWGLLSAPVRAAAGMVDASKRAVGEQFPAESFGSLTMSTDYDPRRHAGELAGENALNLMGMPAIAGGIPMGSAGIFGGRLAKTADHTKLAQAQEMLGRGAFPDEIHSATGWFRGPDGQWRFEIPDQAAKFNRVHTKHTVDNWPVDVPGQTTIGTAFNHPELLAAYPDLKNVVLNFEKGPEFGALGSYSSAADPLVRELGGVENITLATQPSRYGDPLKASRSTMLHELQHAVQQREGFAGGGNPGEFIAGYRSQLNDLSGQVDEINRRLKDAMGTPRYNELLDLRSELVTEINKLQGPHGIGPRELGHRDYKRLAGEVEARNVEHRADWDAQKRADIPPAFSQDTPTADQIVRPRENFGSLSLPMDEASRMARVAPEIINRGNGQYDVRVGGKFAGTASVASDGAKPFISAVDLQPEFRRSGIGSELYRTIESDMGRPLVPSPLGLSPDAARFWQKRLTGATPAERAKLLAESREIGRGYGIPDRDLESRLGVLGANAADQKTGAAAVVANSDFGSLAPEGIRAYHGSPHDFDRFDLSKIGTGEGHQAYGHGLYFADNEAVARTYRDTLGTPRNYAPETIDDKVMQGFLKTENPAVRREIEGFLDGSGYPNDLRMIANREGSPKLRAYLEQHFEPYGRMYEVGIKAKPEQFLDWDTPLARQPHLPLISKALDPRYGNNYTRNFAERGGELKDVVRNLDDGDPAILSKRLRDVGIPGIKYFDGGSRPKSVVDTKHLRMLQENGGDWNKAVDQIIRGYHEKPKEKAAYREQLLRNGPPGQTSNYVVFDDSLVDILRKYALPGAVGAGGFGSLVPGGDQ